MHGDVLKLNQSPPEAAEVKWLRYRSGTACQSCIRGMKAAVFHPAGVGACEGAAPEAFSTWSLGFVAVQDIVP